MFSRALAGWPVYSNKSALSAPAVAEVAFSKICTFQCATAATLRAQARDARIFGLVAVPETFSLHLIHSGPAMPGSDAMPRMGGIRDRAAPDRWLA